MPFFSTVMKHSFLKIAAVLALALSISSAAKADLINGSIGFLGTFSTDDNADFTHATAFTSFTGITFGAATGDYIPLNSFPSAPIVYPAFFQPFSFSATSVVPLWAVQNLGITYAFIATTVNVFTTTNSILAEGSGIAVMTGKDPTPGDWIIEGDGSNGLYLAFSAAAPVPDDGMTVVLVGVGLIGISLFARRQKK